MADGENTLEDRFPATRWSLVLEAQEGDEHSARRALGELCETYWFPIYSYIRNRGNSPQDAEDLTQSFFQTILQRNSLATPDEAKGKLRAFLLSAVKRFLVDAYRRESSQRRGGEVQTVPLDFSCAEYLYNETGPGGAEGAGHFDREWAKIVVTRAVEYLRMEVVKPEAEPRFNAFVPYLTGVEEKPPYEEFAQRFDSTAGSLRKLMSRLREQFRGALEEELADTVATEEELRDEIVYLLGAFAGR